MRHQHCTLKYLMTAATTLPPGWDEAYDPVTGCKYFIDHRSQRTTWTDPRLAVKSNHM